MLLALLVVDIPFLYEDIKSETDPTLPLIYYQYTTQADEGAPALNITDNISGDEIIPKITAYIKQLKPILKKYNIMGVIGACISTEIYAKVVFDLKFLEFPYGFKVNAFKNIPDTWNKAINVNPKEALGFRSDFTPEIFKHFVDNEIQNGASIVGGCCETYPEHISAISN